MKNEIMPEKIEEQFNNPELEISRERES